MLLAPMPENAAVREGGQRGSRFKSCDGILEIGRLHPSGPTPRRAVTLCVDGKCCVAPFFACRLSPRRLFPPLLNSTMIILLDVIQTWFFSTILGLPGNPIPLYDDDDALSTKHEVR